MKERSTRRGKSTCAASGYSPRTWSRQRSTRRWTPSQCTATHPSPICRGRSFASFYITVF
ncbi:hypothetical protein RHGRI_000167 [Rhododendron griersonianum]|uniref:Uncharacterized protein n=1 Tax=Rhododendron griersonianum TaxID=479676 RepID=A0AAV6LFY2_9ERIC|nr:hypothetical protein RHGRI_000167 [Rhododendron griersonianum]